MQNAEQGVQKEEGKKLGMKFALYTASYYEMWRATHKPGRRPSWAAEHAEAIFRRWQKSKLSPAKLAKEFNVTSPTIRAAINHFLAEHPEAKDEDCLSSRGPRRPKIDLAPFADEARRLWEADWSKLKLASKFACSTPVIDKALAFAYEKDGLSVPTQADLRKVKVAKARELLDRGHALEEVAKTLNISNVTARQLLKESFRAEGKQMPDLRRHCRRDG